MYHVLKNPSNTIRFIRNEVFDNLLKLYQKKSGKLKEIEQTMYSKDKLEEYESVIHEMVEKNLGKDFFSEKEFLDSKPTFKLPDGDRVIPDTVTFDTTLQTFVIIDYKNLKDNDLLSQGMDYVRLFTTNKADLVLLHNKKMKNQLSLDDIEWDEAKVIFISPEYSNRQLRAVTQLPKIELFKIAKFGTDHYTLTRETNQQKTSRAKVSHDTKGKTKKKKHLQLEEGSGTVEDYLAGQYSLNTAGKPTKIPDEPIKELYRKLKNRIEEGFTQTEFMQHKTCGRFNFTPDGSRIVSFFAQKSDIWINYTADKQLRQELLKEDFVVDRTPRHYGSGDFGSTIKNEKDIDNAILIIKKIYSSKNP